MKTFTPPTLFDTQRWANKRIGLFGGSFNPVHDGHLHVAKTALQTLDLDFIWWLVTPQNPLKELAPASLSQRIFQCEQLINDPRMIVSDLEQYLTTNNTYETVKSLKKRFQKTSFIWISGMDNALHFHKWQNWQDLLNEISFFYVTRPPADSLIQNFPLRLYKKQQNITINRAGKHPLAPGTTYWMMNQKMNTQSSTKIRNNQL